MKKIIRKKRVTQSFYWFIVILILSLVSAPIIWTFLSSLKTPLDALSIPPVWIFRPTLKNYFQALFKLGVGKAFINSVIIASGATVLTMLVGIPCAYGISRYRFLRYILYLLLLTRVFPPMVIIIPYFLIFKELHLLDTHIGVIISQVTFTLPFAVWLMWSFFYALPTEIDDAALVDGCNRFQALYKVVLPLSLPSLVAISIYTFLGSWNNFFFPLILTRMDTKTLPVVAAGCISGRGIMWGQINAIAVLMLLPVIFFVFMVEKGMLKGLTTGAIK